MKVLSKETKEKLRIAVTGRKLSAETKEKIRLAHSGKKRKPEKIKPAQTFLPNEKISEETREKLRAAKLGRIVDEETRKKISDTLKKRKKILSEQQKQLISVQHTGFKHSLESKEKMSAAHIGKTRSDETRRKMDGNKLGISNVVAYRKVRDVDTGEEFPSLKAAAEKYNIYSSSVSYSCRKKRRCAGHLFEYLEEKKLRVRREKEDKPILTMTTTFENVEKIRSEAKRQGKSISGYIMEIIENRWKEDESRN